MNLSSMPPESTLLSNNSLAIFYAAFSSFAYSGVSASDFILIKLNEMLPTNQHTLLIIKIKADVKSFFISSS
jgi:hypothetical protein